MIAEELGVEYRIQMLPDQPGDVPITYADVRKAGRVLGYSPRVSIREGLRRFVEWYRENDPSTPD
jgi:UDP-glucuronate 4-epimerase